MIGRVAAAALLLAGCAAGACAAPPVAPVPARIGDAAVCARVTTTTAPGGFSWAVRCVTPFVAP